MWLAVLSSLSLTAMVVLDRLMIKDCYEGNVKQALFVSAFASSALGLIATIIYWIIGDVPLSELWHIMRTWMHPYGFLILAAGIMSAQVLYHYFYCFSEDGDSTVIAAWIAATPIFVYTGGYILQFFGLLYEPLLFSPLMLIAVVVTSLSLALLEHISYESDESTGTYRKHLFLMLAFNTAYVLLIDQVIAHAHHVNGLGVKSFVLAFLPLYWIGFSAGMRFMTSATERTRLTHNEYLKKFFIALIFVELLGMFVFFFEFLGLGALDSVSVSIIVGLHVIPVWLISLILMREGKRLGGLEVKEVKWFGLRLTQQTLADFAVRKDNTWLQLGLILSTIFGVSLFLTLSGL